MLAGKEAHTQQLLVLLTAANSHLAHCQSCECMCHRTATTTLQFSIDGWWEEEKEGVEQVAVTITVPTVDWSTHFVDTQSPRPETSFDIPLPLLTAECALRASDEIESYQSWHLNHLNVTSLSSCWHAMTRKDPRCRIQSAARGLSIFAEINGKLSRRVSVLLIATLLN